MSLHSLAKNSHFSFLPSHFPSLPSRRGHHGGAENCNEFTLSIAKICYVKLAMNLHFPLPKIRTIGDELTLPCQKFALFVSPFTLPVSPFTERSPWWRWKLQWVHTFHCQNMFSPSGFVPPLSKGTSRATSDRKPKTNDQILPSPILFFPSKNWIKLIPKTIGNRKRDCAWGGSGW